MEVTAIVPVWNGRELLEKLLVTVARQTVPVAEVIVVDNGSTDGAPESAERWGARVIRMGRNAGFAAAVNRGVAESRAEWLAILNSDVELADDWLARLAQNARWFASGKILSAARPGRIDGGWDLISRAACPWRAGQGRPDGPFFSSAREIAMAPFTALLVKADLFRLAGPLDERFESYLEDVDFGMRCALGGYRGVYVPEAVARHHGSATLGRWNPESVRRMARNQVWLVAKHYPPELRARWRWPIFVGQALWGLVALRHGAGLAWLRGRREGQIGTVNTSATPSIEKLLAESEGEIGSLQEKTGFDWYWRAYFALTRVAL